MTSLSAIVGMLRVPLNVRLGIYRGAVALLLLLIVFVLFRILEGSPADVVPLRYYADAACTQQTEVFATDRAEYRAGDSILLTAYRAMDYDLTYYVSQTYLNLDTGERYALEGFPVAATASACDVRQAPPKVIRQDMKPGRYLLQIVVAIKGRNGRDFVLDGLRTSEFRVVP